MSSISASGCKRDTAEATSSSRPTACTSKPSILSSVLRSWTIVSSSSARTTLDMRLAFPGGFGPRRRGRSGLRRLCGLEGGVQDVVHGLDENKVHALLDLIGDVLEIIFVALGQHDRLQSVPVGGQDLFLY